MTIRRKQRIKWINWKCNVYPRMFSMSSRKFRNRACTKYVDSISSNKKGKEKEGEGEEAGSGFENWKSLRPVIPLAPPDNHDKFCYTLCCGFTLYKALYRRSTGFFARLPRPRLLSGRTFALHPPWNTIHPVSKLYAYPPTPLDTLRLNFKEFTKNFNEEISRMVKYRCRLYGYFFFNVKRKVEGKRVSRDVISHVTLYYTLVELILKLVFRS